MNYYCSLPSSSLQGNYCFAFQSKEVEEMEFLETRGMAGPQNQRE